MSTFVLVHGAWHGGWCWTRVSRGLRQAGHDVYSPSLTGLGDRAHLRAKEVGLNTHVLDVANLVESEDIETPILVGHSYGGMVITGVPDRLPGSISHLVYLDAVVPGPGQSTMDVVPPATRRALEELSRKSDTDWLVPPPEAEYFGVTSAKDVKWVNKHLVPMPLRSLQEVLPYDPKRLDGVRRSYIYCVRPKSGLTATAERVRVDRSWTYREITSGHDAMVTEPARVVETLDELSRAP